MRYRGTDSRGDAWAGRCAPDADAAAVAEDLWAQGWLSLRIVDEHGRTVGAVEPDADGHRVWWAERPAR